MSAKQTDDNTPPRVTAAEGNTVDAARDLKSRMRRGLCMFVASVAVMTAVPASAFAQTAPVLPRPFFEANGGDVVAGSSFATGSAATELCTAGPPNVTNAGIISWNVFTSPNRHLGAGGQYAAMALGYVQHFVTGQGNGRVPAGTETNELTFANTNVNTGGQNSVDPNNGFFGGMFEDAPCADYWTDRPAGITPKPAPVGPLVGTWDSGVYTHAGILTLNRSEIPLDKRITLYVDGNVAIADDIYYNTGYTSREQIPQFRLIVNGIIYISHEVERLDGLYAAIPEIGATTNNKATFDEPLKGTISTCSTNFASFDPNGIPTNNMAGICNKKLTVTGSVVAHQVWLLRTRGDVNANANASAEEFNYNPEMWLAPSGGGINSGYQSIKGLPPIL